MKIQKSFKNKLPTLYIIPTPIGNLEDITVRTLDIIANKIDVLLCEDTRKTGVLLKRYEIDVKTKSFHEFTSEKQMVKYVEEIESGKNYGLVTDAGMPGISDPGYKIINYANDKQLNVVVLPGASAFLVGIVRSNFPNNKFFYNGFLSPNKNQKRIELEHILSLELSTIIYESPHKILATLKLIAELDKGRKILVGREITKLNEEYLEGTASEIELHFLENKPRGEFLVVIKGKQKKTNDENVSIEIMFEELMKTGISKNDAIKKIAKVKKIAKNNVYQKFTKDENE
ncbi:MAG: 16S rRNA (cytidine(1402)-2'-O)-methyltransferase [Spiroplasma sp.]|nr:16S rRNA (cytidine(1402)-2'-O)-methyltransferase [Mycoplasmatales bacterium]